MNPNDNALAELRRRTLAADLGEDASEADPFAQFRRWLQEAQDCKVADPLAMALATVGADQRPSSRIVLLKDWDARGLVFFSNYESRKGEELAANPFAALLFHWGELERMVRIEGRVERTSAGESDASFASRPLDYRIGAWASPQSRVIGGRGVVVANAARFGAQFLLSPPRPAHWGGLRLVPDRWQFWQGRKSKLQDRVRYTQDAAGWLRERLAP